MTPTDLLARIRNVCNEYPENFLGGYIISLIEGSPNEEVLKVWREAKEAKEGGGTPPATVGGGDTHAGGGTSPKDSNGVDAREGSEHTDSGARVDDQPSSDTGLGELEPDGGTNVRRHGRAPDPKHNNRKTKRTTKKDVTK